MEFTIQWFWSRSGGVDRAYKEQSMSYRGGHRRLINTSKTEYAKREEKYDNDRVLNSKREEEFDTWNDVEVANGQQAPTSSDSIEESWGREWDLPHDLLLPAHTAWRRKVKGG